LTGSAIKHDENCYSIFSKRAQRIKIDFQQCSYNGSQKAATAEEQSYSEGLDRVTAYKSVKKVMAEAGISGPQATPKGLRHGFALAMLEADSPVRFISCVTF